MNTNIQLKHEEIFDFVCLSSKINDKVISSFTVLEFINLHVKISLECFSTHICINYLQFVYLQFEYLQFVYLQFVYLQFAYLQFAYLQFTYLQFAYLQFAYLQFVYLQFVYHYVKLLLYLKQVHKISCIA